jgi:hypothetical protein
VPQFPDQDRIDLRKKLIREESAELMCNIDARNMVEVADGFGDLAYVTVGAALEFGVPMPGVWEVIHGANMQKVDPVTGKVRKRADGKILKPDGWVSPNAHIAKMLDQLCYQPTALDREIAHAYANAPRPRWTCKPCGTGNDSRNTYCNICGAEDR